MTTLFNRPDVLVESWYWALPSRRLSAGQAMTVNVIGQPTTLYRSASGRVHALDARCPHVGADLGLGRVCGETLRCRFHHWTFAGDGRCVAAPPRADIPPRAHARAWPVTEKHGMIWIYSGSQAAFPVPDFPPHPAGYRMLHLGPEEFNCHHHVVTANAVDVGHLGPVHALEPVGQQALEIVSEHQCRLRMDLHLTGSGALQRGLRRLAGNRLSTTISLWGGNLATLETLVGRNRLCVLFANRPRDDGVRSHSVTLVGIPRMNGLAGALGGDLWRAVIPLMVMSYLAVGDADIFNTIRFHPTLADGPLLAFIRHVNAMKYTIQYKGDQDGAQRRQHPVHPQVGLASRPRSDS